MNTKSVILLHTFCSPLGSFKAGTTVSLPEDIAIDLVKNHFAKWVTPKKIEVATKPEKQVRTADVKKVAVPKKAVK